MMNTTYTEDANTNPNQAVIRISEATQYDYEKDEIRRAVTYERGPFGFIDNSTLGDNVETDASKVGGHLTIIEGTVNLNCMAITLEEAENLSNILAMAILAYRRQLKDAYNFLEITPLSVSSPVSLIHSGGSDDMVHVSVSIRYQINVSWIVSAATEAIHKKTYINAITSTYENTKS